MLHEQDILNIIEELKAKITSAQPADKSITDELKTPDQLKGKSEADNFSETVEEMPLASTSSRTQRLRPVKTGAHAKSFPKNSSASDFLRIFKLSNAIFLVIHENTNPLRIDLKCDKKLAKLLISRYETIQKSTLLGNQGIEIILTNQLPETDIKDLITHSFHRAKTP